MAGPPAASWTIFGAGETPALRSHRFRCGNDELHEGTFDARTTRSPAALGGGTLDQNIAIVADVQRDAIKRTIKHVDLHRINPNEKIRITVPVVLTGTAAGVKEGGLLDLAHHELHIECLPGNIPDSITIDVTDLKIAHSIHVSEIVLPNGIVVLDQPKIPVVSVLGRAKEDAPAA